MSNSKVPDTNKINKTISIARIFEKRAVTELSGLL